jgi:hypothetical protein
VLPVGTRLARVLLRRGVGDLRRCGNERGKQQCAQHERKNPFDFHRFTSLSLSIVTKKRTAAAGKPALTVRSSRCFGRSQTRQIDLSVFLSV